MVDSAFFVKSRNQLLLELSLDLFNTLQIFTLVNLFVLFSMLGVGGKGGGVGLSSKSYLLPSFISSVLFLSNFQTLNIFVTLFSGTVRPTKLKLCTHLCNGWLESGCCCCLFIPLFILLSLQFST